MLLWVDDQLGTLDVDDGLAYVTERVDLPLPQVRVVTEDRVQADGTLDSTAWFGARAITASVVAFAAPGVSLEARVDQLRAYLLPSRRFLFQWTPLGAATARQLLVRPDSHDVILQDPRWARTTVNLVAPRGVAESVAEHEVTIAPAPLGSAAGRAYNLTYGRTYPAGSGSATEVLVTNQGTSEACWMAKLYGPCTDPELTNRTLGESLAFSGLTLAAGEYVELDCEAHTALLNSDPTLPVYNRLTLASDWWPLLPGVNRIAYEPSAWTPGAAAVLTWRDTWA